MSTSVQHQTQISHVTADLQPRPVVAEAMQRIATIAEYDDSAVISDCEISFENHGERTTISVEPINVDTIDGQRITECITIRTPLAGFKLFDEEHYSFVNIFATTGAVVRDDDGQDAIVSRLPLYEGDDAALADLYTPVIANGALLQVIGAVCGFYHSQNRGQEIEPGEIALPNWDDPSAWDGVEFVCAEDRLRQCGAFANAGPDGLTVEFAWETGAVSAIAEDCTSLLQIRADEPHPWAGNGLFYRLDLPLNFNDGEARQWAVRMNRIEAGSLDTPPLFGAWCTLPESGRLSFAGFWPNVMFRPGTATNIAFWCWARSRFARQALSNLH